MRNRKFLTVALIIYFNFYLLSTAQPLILKTENLEEVIDISSFILNSKGETFLYSRKLSKVFKFKSNGTFEKSFCRKGEGPGEVFRVFKVLYNPVNDCLYLPDYASGGKGHVTIFDNNGNFKGLLKPEISRLHMDRIWNLFFLKDGSYLVETHERVGWKPEGKFFVTQQEVWVRYFNSDGKLISDIFKITNPGELSHAVNYGGPAIFFRPYTVVNITPDEKYIAIAQTDENTVSLFDKQGEKVKTITLEIPRHKITKKEFENYKKRWLKFFKGKMDSRMYYLAKNMIKLEYKPIYWKQFLTKNYIILQKDNSKTGDGYIKTCKLLFFDWNGKKKGEKVIEGYVMNKSGDKGLIKFYDDETNEYFKVEPEIFRLVQGSDRN